MRFQDEEWDDDDDGLGVPEGKGEFDFLSCKYPPSFVYLSIPPPLDMNVWNADIVAWLDDDGGGDNEAQDDDEDLKSDPVAQIDMVVSPPSYQDQQKQNLSSDRT